MRPADDRFGRNGHPPTDFETELLSNCHNIDDIWVAVGKRIGSQALFELFAEIGGMIVSVPTRESFVQRVYLPVRDAEMLVLSRQGKTDAELAGVYRMTPQGIRNAIQRGLRTMRAGKW